ncbi:alpha/beta hydrolase [Halobacillus salinus]|uniref:alpha/beta hydrolase n=1 Tax=Halobacillus salinus TaxID=192814 RepID=UPI00130520FC|nr:alpha/beta hydrolase [Halobacillus salinus]
MTDKRKLFPLVIFTLLIGLLLFFSASKPTRSEYKTTETPTLFIHGYKGTERSFSTMLDRLERNHWGEKQMVVRVSKQGDLNIKGNTSDGNPLIHVVFEDNRAALSEQKKWLHTIMKTLRSDYEVENVHLVGHSMGGLAATGYLTDERPNEPEVLKLVVLASPFNGIQKEHYFKVNYGAAANDLKPDSKALQQLTKHKIKETNVLSIAGVINPDMPYKKQWDGLVHLKSAKGVEEMVRDTRLSSEVIEGDRATHSGLHEMHAVDRLIADFLWGPHKN